MYCFPASRIAEKAATKCGLDHSFFYFKANIRGHFLKSPFIKSDKIGGLNMVEMSDIVVGQEK
jgi:hypothetical protein